MKSTTTLRWNGKKTVPFTTMVSPATYNALHIIKEAYDIPKSTLIRDLLYDLIDSEYEKAKQILETRQANKQSKLNTANPPPPENNPPVQQ